jgi:hypothetical protein
MRIVGYIFGALLVVIALPLLILGIGAIIVGGGFDVPLKGMTAPPKVVAVVSPEFTLKAADLPSQVRDASVQLKVTPTAGGAPLFVGLASSADVKRYLRNATIAHPDLPKDANGNGQPPDPQTVVSGDGVTMQLAVEPGKRKKVAPPGTKAFWIRQADTASGAIALSVPDLDGKDVRVVVMRADGKPGMAFDAVATIHIPVIRPIGIGVLAAGIVLVALGAGLIVLIATRGRRTPPAAPPAPDAPAVDTA